VFIVKSGYADVPCQPTYHHISYRAMTLSGSLATCECPFSVGRVRPCISHMISFSDGAKRNFESRTDKTTSVMLVIGIVSPKDRKITYSSQVGKT
jgi:hypothetical protein